MNIPVVYEDDWMLIVDKPPGLLTVPTPKKEPRTLTSILNEESHKQGLKYNLYPCHRLDRETSGLIIYAKGKSARDKITDLFRQKKVKKTYLAFVQGVLSGSGKIKNFIDNASALTKYTAIRAGKNFTVVEAAPFTGRTNQIRIHFKQIGHPVVGETKYAFRNDFALKAKRLCLHAKSLDFFHPVTGKRISIDIPLPPDMNAFLDKH